MRCLLLESAAAQTGAGTIHTVDGNAQAAPEEGKWWTYALTRGRNGNIYEATVAVAGVGRACGVHFGCLW
ncbi:hypothetical protein BH20CHL2_BH20CHL2_08070 [soil metagenome]